MKQPRDYQMDAHNALINYIHEPANYGKNPLVVEATGLGKSLNIAMFMWHMLNAYPHLRMMQLCHVKELVEGNYKELLGMWPAAPAGIYAAGLNRTDTRAQLTFAMINSVAKRPATFGHIDFLVIDEAHRLSPNDSAMYSKFIAALKQKNPNLIVVGYTATDFRMGQGMLTDGELFDEVVYNIGGGESFLWAVEQGYLIRPVPTDPGFQLDDTGIGLSAGDFNTSEASAALEEQDILERAVDYTIKVSAEEGRKCGITFAQSIDHAELIADMFTYKGWPTEAVHSKRNDRDEVLKVHKEGGLWGVTNKDVLTTGWNNPILDILIALRLTRSPGLWVQMVGRLTRPSWGGNYHFGHNGGPPLDDSGSFNLGTKEGRLLSIASSHKFTGRVLDFVGNTERLGPINYPNIPRRRGKGGGEQPVRTCHQCEPATYHHVSVKVCPECGFEFPVNQVLRTEASSAELVSATNPLGLPVPKKVEKEFKVYGVHQMICTHNVGKDKADGTKKPDTMKVAYRSGYTTLNAWICFEHPEGNFARRKAEQWWRDHGGQGAAPTTVAEALELADTLTKPKFINVWANTKFPEITAYDFEGTRFEPIDLTDLNNIKPRELHEPEPDPMPPQQADDMSKPLEIGGEYYYDDDDIPF